MYTPFGRDGEIGGSQDADVRDKEPKMEAKRDLNGVVVFGEEAAGSTGGG